MTSFVISGAALVDVEQAEALPDANLWIDEGTIVDLTFGRRPSANVPVLDASGKYLVPGLIDLHTHVMAATSNLADLARMSPTYVTARATVAMRAMLARGFTTARDAGGADWGLAEAQRQGLVVGPALYPSGLAIAQTGGQGDVRGPNELQVGCTQCYSIRSIARVADGVDGVRIAARDELRKGATQIKVMASGGLAGRRAPELSHFSEGELRALVEEAAFAGTYVMAHAYGPESITRAVAAGVRTIEHGNLIDEATARAMAGKAVMVPTLAAYHAHIERAQVLGLTPETVERFQRILEAGQTALETCQRAGVTMGFGTDLEGDLDAFQADEFALRANVLGSPEVLRSATTVPAQVLGLEGTVGTLAAGAAADVLIVDKNPLDDVTALARSGPGGLRTVIQQGVIRGES